MHSSPDEHTWIDYASFAARFFEHAVTLERVTAAVSGLAGRGLRFEPLKAGPLGLVEIAFVGEIGRPTVRRAEGDMVTFAVEVPITTELRVRFGHEARVRGDVVIDLRLVARPADPVLIVIDAPPVDEHMVRVKIHGDGLAGAVPLTIEPLLPEIRRRLASAVNALLGSRDAVRGRVIDVAARLENGTELALPPGPFRWIDYSTFGARFFALAVTEKRLASAFGELAGRSIEIAPFRTGPKARAEVSAHGVVGTAALTARHSDLVAFDATVPLTLELVVRFLREHRYRAFISIDLVLRARAADPLLLVVDIPPITGEQVRIAVAADGMAASALKTVGGIENRIREQVLTKVNAELADDSGRVFDVGARVDAV